MQYKTFNELQPLGLDAVPEGYDKTENSFIHQAVTAAAIIGHELMIQASYIYDMQFADNWRGGDMDVRVYDATGITRKPALAAKTTVRFIGKDGTYIPQGTRISDGQSIFLTMAGDYIKNGVLETTVIAETPGFISPIAPGELTKLEEPIVGVASLTNVDPFENGRDVESDTSLLARYRAFFSERPVNNNPAQFREWAREVQGVGQARVLRANKETGVVTLILLNDSFEPASAELIEKTKKYIESQMGFDVTLVILPAKAVAFTLTIEAKIGAGYEKEDVEAALTESIKQQLAFHPDPSFIKDSLFKYELLPTIQESPALYDLVDVKWDMPGNVMRLNADEVAVLKKVEVVS